MSSTTIVNGAPMTILQGTQDKSIRAAVAPADVLPTHLPKMYLYCQKGPSGPQLVAGNARNQLYGDDTFDLRKGFANHQTVLSNLLNAQGNAQMIERVVPVDAGPNSNYLLSLDVLPTAIPQYQRDTEGKVMVDPNTGLSLLESPAATLPGYQVKLVVSNVSVKAGKTNAQLFGVTATMPGDQTDGVAQSTRYPLLEFWANSEGEYFNNAGHRVWAPTVTSTGGVNAGIMATNKVYPYRMSAVRRSSPMASARVVATEDGSPYFDFSLKAGQINPATTAQFSLGDIYLNKFQTTDSIAYADKFGDLNGMAIYQANIDLLTDMFYTAEMTYMNAGSDWTGAADEQYLFNLLGGTSSNGTQYYTYVMDDGASDAIRLTESTNLFAKGGSDGTMNDTLFAGLVGDAVAEYANPDSYLMDTASMPESFLYDTGFPLATKFELCKFIAERKDTAVVLSTYVVGGENMDASEDHSIAVALRTRLQMYPESDYFGTATMRGVVMGRHGTLIDSLYTRPLPLTLELGVMAAKMMGAGNGIWKPEALFDKSPGSLITLFKDVNIRFTPAKQRNKDWAVGLNYPMAYTRKTLYLPAIKTVYDNDTSVLNSFFVMAVCLELQKVGERTHRNFSGSIELTNAQLIDRVNKDVVRQTTGRFASLVQIVPNAYISDGDEQRGYSWTLPISLFANSMKSVMTLRVEANRMSDYIAAS
jgi:hypothetical protein